MNNWYSFIALCSYRKYHSCFCKMRVQRYLQMAHSGPVSAGKLTFLVCRVSLGCNSEGRACPRSLSHMPPAMCSHSHHYRDARIMVLTWKPLHIEEPAILSWPWWARLVPSCRPSVASRMCCAWPSAAGQPSPAHGDGGVAASSHTVPAAVHLCGLALT